MADTIQAQSATQKKKISLHEDWTVVVLGFLIIALVIIGLEIPVPSFSWGSIDELTGTVLATDNLIRILLQFVVIYAIAVGAAFL